MPLLVTKLRRPRVRASVVARPRLVERLDATGRALTLVSAPAGFGKTTLLAEWLARALPTTLVAWLSLDEDDNDLARFLVYLVAALETAREGVGSAALALLEGARPPSARPFLTLLLNDLADLPDDLFLVLDDYHVISAASVHDAVAFLLANLPPRLHVVIATRSDPPLPLSRLRVRDQLVELRGSDLLFDLAEADAFLNREMGLGLDSRDVGALQSSTEGWVAGLQLAALSLRRRPDVAALVATLGSQPHVVDYLVDEVLSQQPEPLRQFLLETSVLSQLTADLCDALSGRGDGEALLAQVERANLLITPLDGERRWYRYHHLFAECLRGRLRAEQPASLPELHRRASRWYEEQGLLDEALGHALAAPDLELAARLVEARAPGLLAQGRAAAVLGYLDRLPDELVRANPRLASRAASALAATGRLDSAEAYLRSAKKGLESADASDDSAVREWLASTRAGIATLRGDVRETIEHAPKALSRLPSSEPAARSQLAFHLGIACHFAGDVLAAGEAFAESIESSLAAGDLGRATAAAAHLARVELTRGRLVEAERVCWQAIERVGRAPAPAGRVPTLGLVYASLGQVRRERGDLAGAAECLEEALRLAEESGAFDGLALTQMTLAYLRLAEGDLSSALDAVEEAVRLSRDVVPLRRYVLAERVPLLLAAGRREEVERWARECPLGQADVPALIGEREALSLAQLRLARGEPSEALAILERLRGPAEAAGHGGAVIQILTLQSLALAATGERAMALGRLGRALALAEPAGFVRAFADYGEPLVALVREAARSGPESERASRLLRALASTARAEPAEAATDAPGREARSVVEALTAREVEVLRLLAVGASNQRIADELVVSIGTVKAHVSHILDKLGAENRTAAVVRARALGLLERE